MTVLNRTHLNSPQKAQLSAAALARQDGPGTFADLSRKYGVSRPTIDSAGATASSVLNEFFGKTGSGQAPAVNVKVDTAQLHRSVVALRAMAPNSIRATVDIIKVMHPGVNISYGTVQKISSEAENKASALNAAADLSNIHSGALDEMFSQGDPVLAGIDLDSGFLFGLFLELKRGGDEWAAFLEKAKAQRMDLEVVVKDAAKGIEAGVRKVFPNAEQRDDAFHAHYEMGKVRFHLEMRAYGAITKEEKALEQLNKAIKTKQSKLIAECVVEYQEARRNCLHAMDLHDTFEQAMREAQEAMEFIDLKTGHIRTPEEMQEKIEAAAKKMMAIKHHKCTKVGKYLLNRAPGLVLYMKEMVQKFEELAQEYGKESIEAAVVVWQLVNNLQNKRRPLSTYQDQQHLLGAYAQLKQLLGADSEPLMDAVTAIIEKRHRASSAVEGFNAALRPFLYVHKGVTQGFLELFRARYNLRQRQWGPHKGTSAHECLTGQPVDDWLTLLGYPPSTTPH